MFGFVLRWVAGVWLLIAVAVIAAEWLSEPATLEGFETASASSEGDAPDDTLSVTTGSFHVNVWDESLSRYDAMPVSARLAIGNMVDAKIICDSLPRVEALVAEMFDGRILKPGEWNDITSPTVAESVRRRINAGLEAEYVAEITLSIDGGAVAKAGNCGS